MKKIKNRKAEYAKRKQERVHEKIAAFEEFSNDAVLRKVAQMIKDGGSAADIMKYAAPLAAARIVTEAINNPNASAAVAASKDIIDRAQGRAKETVETTHKFDNLDDEQLDALLISKVAEAGIKEKQ